MDEKRIYQIVLPEKKSIEFYTFWEPTIKDNQLCCKHLMQKGKVTEVILGENLEEFYRIEVTKEKEGVDHFNLTDGVTIKLTTYDEQNEMFIWLNQTKEQAESLLKDKVLEYYQLTVPKLIKGMEQMQKQLDSLKGGQSGQNKKNNLLIQ